MEAQKRLGYEVNKEDVINDYRRMRELGLINWKWERSDRIR
jgi:hypothetical protein